MYPRNSLLSDLVPDFQVEEMTIHKMINVPRNLSSQFTSQFQDRGSLFLGNNLEVIWFPVQEITIPKIIIVPRNLTLESTIPIWFPVQEMKIPKIIIVIVSRNLS